MKNYGIKDGYIINSDNSHHVDNGYTDEGQKDVYEFAKSIMLKNGYKTIVDIGCGSGFKLMKYFEEFDTTGYEVEPVLTHLRTTYPTRKWVDSGTASKDFKGVIGECDVLICADVIEHISDPDLLLNYIKRFNSKAIIISTPCREILCKSDKHKHSYGSSYNGPPINRCHVREWTTDEFVAYLNTHFTVIESYLGKEQIECQYHLLKL